jgi:hypothetical protein
MQVMKEEVNENVVEQVENAPTAEETKQAVEEAIKEIEDSQEAPRLYELANFISVCSCGGTDVIIPDTKDGVKLELYPTDVHEATVGCSKCGTVIKLRFEEVIEEPQVDVEADEEPVQNKEVENEEPVHEENTETESV